MGKKARSLYQVTALRRSSIWAAEISEHVEGKLLNLSIIRIYQVLCLRKVMNALVPAYTLPVPAISFPGPGNR